MRIGNLTQTVWKRSVQKQLHNRREEFLIKPMQGERCSALRIGTQSFGQLDRLDRSDSVKRDVVITANATANGNSSQIGVYAVCRAVNDLACRGAEPSGVSLQFVLPEWVAEEQFRDLVGAAEEVCGDMELQLTGVWAETSPAVRQIFVSANAIGIGKENLISLGGAVEGEEIVLCGSIGLEGALRILDEREAELSKRFVPAFIRQTKAHRKELCPIQAIQAVTPYVSAMQQIGSGGILAALWELAEASAVGFQVAMGQMTICQETVEICEYYRLNPYQMTSGGAVLLVTREAQKVLRLLEKEGVRASRLGMIHAGNARVITSGEETRYLDRPAKDELARWLAEQAIENE